MEQGKIARTVSRINEMIVDEALSLEEVEAVIHSLTRHFLDNLTEISDIDYFQDRVNDMVDNYVETHFEENLEESAG
jgi:hypothetical protein